jgi:hypothetical protein
MGIVGDDSGERRLTILRGGVGESRTEVSLAVLKKTM